MNAGNANFARAGKYIPCEVLLFILNTSVSQMRSAINTTSLLIIKYHLVFFLKPSLT